MNTYRDKNGRFCKRSLVERNLLSKYFSLMTLLALVFTYVTPVTLLAEHKPDHQGAQNPQYDINITEVGIGALSITLSGNASATNFAGQENDQHVTIDWGDGQISEEISSFNYIVSGDDFSGIWGPITHNYSSAGPVTIVAIVHHAKYKGKESGDATETINVTIPPPNPEEECLEQGGSWNGESCEFPPTPEEECLENGGSWNGESCEFPPNPEEECLEQGGSWNGESCEFPPTPGPEPEPEPEPQPEPTPTPTGGGGGSFSGGRRRDISGGEVLGAATTFGETCGLYMDRYLRFGIPNDAEQVRKLQEFLNRHLGANLPITGVFGPLTLEAVNQFQTMYTDQILTPWGESAPTGIVYLTTLRQINMLECPELSLTLPELVPWSRNPVLRLSLTQ